MIMCDWCEKFQWDCEAQGPFNICPTCKVDPEWMTIQAALEGKLGPVTVWFALWDDYNLVSNSEPERDTSENEAENGWLH